MHGSNNNNPYHYSSFLLPVNRNTCKHLLQLTCFWQSLPTSHMSRSPFAPGLSQFNSTFRSCSPLCFCWSYSFCLESPSPFLLPKSYPKAKSFLKHLLSYETVTVADTWIFFILDCIVYIFHYLNYNMIQLFNWFLQESLSLLRARKILCLSLHYLCPLAYCVLYLLSTY